MSKIQIASALTGFSLLLVLGCHSTPLKNTPRGGVGFAEQTDWLKKYKQAKLLQETDPTQSCVLFKELAAEKKFPVQKLAELRADETCPNTSTVRIDRSQLPPWLADLGLEVSLKLAQKNGDKTAEMDLAMEKSKQRLPQSEKIKWAQLAIERAQELGQAQTVAEYKKRLYKIAPRLDPEPDDKDMLAVANDYRFARQFDKARAAYEAVISNKGYKIEEKIAALKGLRLSYKNARNNEAHLQACLRTSSFIKRAIKANPKSHSLRIAAYDADMYYGRALWTMHRAKDARAVFNSLEKRVKGQLSLAELYWLKGRMAEEGKDYDEVADNMGRALKEKATGPDLRDKILWYNAWNERRRQKFESAAELLQQLSEQTAVDFTRQRALFWLGKTQADMNRTDEAKATFDKLTQLDPLGYYGLLAHKQTGTAITLKASERGPASVEEVPVPLDTTIAEWLVLLGEKDSLNDLLNIASADYGKMPNQNDEGWISLFKYYAKGGLYMKLYEALGTLTPERRKAILENHPELLFPQPWNAEIKEAALQFGVGEELIYAIIRQESAFDPNARSIADAFGLMQVLPEIAETLAGPNKIPYEEMDDLYNPRTNIMIGTAHVKELLDRHKDQFILAVASYNANENAIKNWVKTRYRGDSLEFIEEIPYEETRAYVRLVMRNMIFYSLLKSQSASIEFPSWVLKMEPTT